MYKCIIEFCITWRCEIKIYVLYKNKYISTAKNKYNINYLNKINLTIAQIADIVWFFVLLWKEIGQQWFFVYKNICVEIYVKSF